MVAREHLEYSQVKKRTEVVFVFFLLLGLAIGARLTYLQWAKGREFARLAARMQGRVIEVDARRGRILDRHGNYLATDILGKAIIINPRIVADAAATAARLAHFLGLTEPERAEIQQLIERGAARHSAYCRLRRGVDRRLAERIHRIAAAGAEPALKGLWLEDSPVRVYPSGRDGIQIAGNVNVDGEGIEAIELMYNRVLRGQDGERQVRVDAVGRPVPDPRAAAFIEPVDGQDVRLTLDRDIQHFVEGELDNLASAQSPDAATAVVMDVKTGDVLAMASYPGFSPSQAKVLPAQRRNRAVTDLFEPGSTFKMITAAAALESNIHATAHCGGRRAIGKWTIGCAHGQAHGAVSLRKMVEKSCNIAAGRYSELVGPQRMYDVLDRFGFFSKTGIELPGEEYAATLPPSEWRTIRTVNIGFGQGIQVTPIQLLAACSAIANDGVYNPPRLVLEAPGMEPRRREPRRAMSAGNAAELRGHMHAVTVTGTGKLARVPGYTVAGKTGTAQIARNGRYGYGYVASFVGFIPASRPRLAILVSAWRPRHGQYGGTVAAPVWREIARRSVDFLGIPPDAPEELRGARVRTAVRAEGLHD